MKDNIENDISVGDYVFCYSGHFKNTVQKVTGFRHSNGEGLNGVTEAVNFDAGRWLAAYNVVSLNALGVDVSAIGKSGSKDHRDALGNVISVGDRVLFLHAKECNTEAGIVKALSNQTCLLSIELNRFGKDEYRKKYEELISLTAIGYDKEIIHSKPWQ